MKNNAEYCLYYELQIVAIRQHRWIESEKAGRDLGKFAEYDWINRFGKIFYQEWGWLVNE